MPSSDVVLQDATRIANAALPVAFIWHGAVVAMLTALLLGWRPSRRVIAVLFAAPIASVSVVSLALGSTFSGVVFGLLTLVLVAQLRRAPRDRAEAADYPTLFAGALLVGLAFVYPQFLRSHSPLLHVVGAPIGLLPCPTLMLVIGSSLACRVAGTRASSLVLAGAGLYYGVVGVLWLGVYLDAALLAGALMLLGVTLQRGAAQPSKTANKHP